MEARSCGAQDSRGRTLQAYGSAGLDAEIGDVIGAVDDAIAPLATTHPTRMSVPFRCICVGEGNGRMYCASITVHRPETCARLLKFPIRLFLVKERPLNSGRKTFLATLAVMGVTLAGGAVVFSCGGMDHDGDKNVASEMPSSDAVPPLTGDALIVVNGGDATLIAIDVATLEPKATIKLKNLAYPHHVSLGRDGRSIAIAAPGADFSGGHGGAMPAPAGASPPVATPHGGGHSLQDNMGHGSTGALRPAIIVLEAATGKTIVSSQLEHPNHNAAFSPDGTEIWTGQMSTPGTVLVLDAATLAPKSTLPVGTMPAEVTFSADGLRAFVANGADATVSVFDVATKAPVATVAVGANPVGAWKGSDGVMYVDNETDKTISAIDAKTASVVRTYALGFTPGMAATSPSNELWVTNVDGGKVVVFAAGSTDVAGEIQAGIGVHALVFSADGATAFVSNQSAGTVTVIDVGTKSPKKTIPVGSKPNGLVYVKIPAS